MELEEKVEDFLGGGVHKFEDVDEVTLNEVYRVRSDDGVYYVKRFVSQDWFDRLINPFDNRNKLSFPEKEERLRTEVGSEKYLREAGFKTPSIEVLDDYTILKEEVSGVTFRNVWPDLDPELARELGSTLGELFWNLNSNDIALMDTTPDNIRLDYEDEWEAYIVDSEFVETEADQRDIYEDIFGVISPAFRQEEDIHNEFLTGFQDAYIELPDRYQEVGFLNSMLNSAMNLDFDGLSNSYSNWR